MNCVSIVCQNCGVGLEVEDNVASFVCPNCGCRINKYDYDRAAVRADQQGQSEHHHVSSNQKSKSGGIIAIILTILIFVGIGFWLGRTTPAPPPAPRPTSVTTQARWPYTYKEAKKKTYQQLKTYLTKECKFTNVTGIPVEIPKINVKNIKSGKIKDIDIITVGDTFHFKDIEKNQEFASDVLIRITYYN